MAKNTLIRGSVLKYGAHEQHRIEPETNLLTHFNDPFGRVVLFPFLFIGEVARSRERNDTGVKPYVADFADTLDFRAALRALDFHFVNPRTVKLGKCVHLRRVNSELFKLFLAADNVDVAAVGADIKRKRHTVVTLTGDIPVAHVIQPVNHSLAVRFRLPFNGGSRLDESRLEFVRSDVPCRNETENNLALTTPAYRVAVLDRHNLVKLVSLFKLIENLGSDFGAVLAGHEAEAFEEDTHIVNGHHLGQADTLAKLVIFDTTARSDMNDARTLFGVNVLPGDDFMVNVLLCVKLREAGFIRQSDKLTAFEHTENFELVLA